MIFSGCEHMKKIPFHTVLIHGLIRDPQGKKCPSPPANGVDPIEVINTYGADALRFNIITGNSPNDMRFFPERCEAMRNFANKLWNASRFVMMNLTINKNELPETLELEDKWILSRFNELAREVGENLDKYELGIAAQKIYDFIWDSFCDWYIELTKARLTGEDETARVQAEGAAVCAHRNAQAAPSRSCRSSPRRSIRRFCVEGDTHGAAVPRLPRGYGFPSGERAL